MSIAQYTCWFASVKTGLVRLLEKIDIFVNCDWVDTWWQQYSKHLHTNNTQNNTTDTNNTQNNTINLGRVRFVPRLWELYPGICLTTEEKSPFILRIIQKHENV